ncbi:MAG: hypothetical protein WBC44_21070 [Planctomycetaceae bacterium]
MPTSFHPFSFVIAVALAFLVGCGRPGPTETAQTGDSAKSAATDVGSGGTKAAEASEGTTASASVTNDDPAAAFRRLAADLVEGRTAEIADAVPQCLRDDLGRLWHESVQTIDSSTRRDAADAVATFAEVLARKRVFVLGSDRIELEGAAADFVRRRFDAIARVIASIARWPGWSAEGDDVDAAALVERVTKAIASEPALQDELRSLRFETLTLDGSDAIVRIRNADRAEGFDVPVSLVEGRWVPTRIAESLSGTVRSSGDDEARQSSLQRLTQQLRQVAETLEGVTTQQEFDAQADHAATLLMASAGRSVEAVSAIGSEELATIHVLGKITAEEKDRLLWAFVARTDSPASGLADAADRTDGDGMNVTIGPVADVEEFAKRLPGVTVEKVDRETRTITVRVGEP